MLQRMRTIKGAYQEIKENDPNSGLTETGLRTMVITGAIPSVRVGAKYLINMAALETYLAGAKPASAEPTKNQIMPTYRIGQPKK